MAQPGKHSAASTNYRYLGKLDMFQGGLDDSSVFHDKFNQMIESEVERRLEAEVELRAEKEREERELMLLEKERELETLRVQHEREMYLIKKKLSVASSTSKLSDSTHTTAGISLTLSIPRYRTVGVGKTSYVEYEVCVTENLGEDQKVSSLFRRYRQFRDLHNALSSRYQPVTSLPFPSRKLFGSKSDSVSTERQRDLQHYLNNLIFACSKIAGCPLQSGLNRENLAALSTFFQTNNAESSETG